MSRLSEDLSYSIEIGVPADTAALLRCTGVCSVDDRHTQLKSIAHRYGSRSEDIIRYHSECMESLFQRSFEVAKYDVVVARKKDGSVIGYAIWARTETDPAASSRETITDIPPFTLSKETLKTVANMERTTSAAMNHYIAHLMPKDHACRYIVSICIEPAYQGQGIGTALLNWGFTKADVESVPCWVSSGHDALQIFERRGFREVGRFQLCLDDWAEGIVRPIHLRQNPDNGEWGTYIWTWLVRPCVKQA